MVLLVYHHIIHFAYKNLQKDNYTKSVKRLKTMSNAGFIFLISIVALAVLKDSINIILMIGGLAVITFLVFVGSRALLKNSAKN